MPYHTYPPPPALRPWVQGAWRIERHFELPQLTQTILPDSYVELVFNLGDPYAVAGATGRPQLAPACYLVGLLREPLRVQAAAGATLRTLAVRCYPWAAALLGVLPARLTQPLTALPGPPYAALWPHLRQLTLAGQHGAAAADLLGCLAARLPAQLPGLASLLHLRAQPAGVAIGASFGAARRRLERCCRRYAGTSPKQLQRLLRFEQASHYLHAHPQASLAAVAYEFGYADQAHFTREFRALAGQPPGAFVRQQ